jgi:Zn-finger nucleic acid-binding protein
MADRAGIEIDYCPTCRGVWLDRGELDKIIERTASPAPAVAPVASGNSKYHEPPYKKKKSSMLGDLFDF